MVELPEDVEELQLFESFHLQCDFPVEVGQLHIIWGLLQDESLYGNSGITYNSELLNGKRSCLIKSLPDSEDFSSIFSFIAQSPGEVENSPPGIVYQNSSTSRRPWISLRGPIHLQNVLIQRGSPFNKLLLF